jgi:hypothetical protein
MIARSIVLTLPLAVFTLAGCTSSTSQPVAQTPTRTVDPAAERTDVITTNLPPMDAAKQVAQEFKAFRFKGLVNGQLAGTARPDGDFFFARVGAQSAGGETMSAVCVWKAEGETEVRFQSVLPLRQHEFVSSHIRQSLACPGPTTQASIDLPE